MMPSAVPPGRQREQELIERLDAVQAEMEELRSALPAVNDPVLRTHAQALAERAAAVISAHRGRLGPDIADDLAGLVSAAHTLRVPSEDPELGRTQTLQTLRTAKGLIVAALGDALDAARALGLCPREVSLRVLPVAVPRTGNEGLLRGIAKRLDEVVTGLDALEHATAAPTSFPQQAGLVNIYVGAMRVEVNLAKLHLTVGEQTVDLNALARAVEVIVELTGDFIETIRAWVRRVSDEVTRVAEEVRTRVRRLAAGTSAAAKWIGRKARLSRAAPVEPGHSSLLDGRAGEMELSFDPSDPECIAQVAVTVFRQGGTVERSSLATSIRVRVHADTSVTLKNVMAYITEIEKLTFNGEWQRSNSPDIQTTWTDTNNFLTDIPSSNVKYVNVLHIDNTDNKITVWQTPMPASLVDFVKDMTTYRFMVSVMAREVRHIGIEIDWKGHWDQIQVRAATRGEPLKSPVFAVKEEQVCFDYSEHDGYITVGEGDAMFSLQFSKASDTQIRLIRANQNMEIARVKGANSGQIIGFYQYPHTSTSYTLSVGEHFIVKNESGYFMHGRILSIKDDTRGADTDEICFKYQIDLEKKSEFHAL